ncbi:MAG: tRNA 2-thiouridine(34) synthase MnmA [Candidatus Nealsonbacteria bacterium]|nr:tRNA 2-thiouridine(34) synthase MnmA [Candidatus Nealsonbacteria bacterium]
MQHQSLPTGSHKIIIAMSGGVDSSVAAALLKRAGFNVAGVFMRFWHESGKAENRCCSSDSEKRARAVASKLGIPFYAFNFEKEFKKRIVDCFLRDYKAGLTPNPCVVCNKEIKFGLLLEKALALGADFIATGHYVKIHKFVNSKQIRYSLMTAQDKAKDQSYFLWQLNQKQLSRVLFPVGDYTKPEVRKLAKRFGLPTAATPDSQEVCFVPDTINNFLAKYIKPKPGHICASSEEAQIVLPPRKHKPKPKHQGLAFYTIGQRKGIGLSGGPYWVLGKNFKKNRLIVTKNQKDLLKKELIFKNANWLSVEPKLPLRVMAKIRYRSKISAAMLYKNKLIFNRPQRAITPGQSVVFYLPRRQAGKGQELIGGGIISS